MNTRGKTWQADYAPSSEEDEESGVEDQHNKGENEENIKKSETVEAQYADPKNSGEGTQNGAVILTNAFFHTGEETQTNIVIHADAPSSGLKREHESEKSDSDKEQASSQQPEVAACRQLVVTAPPQGRWVEVKNKRKGKKGKIKAYYQP